MKTVSILAATLLAVTAQANADELPTRSIAVQYADLNLDQSEGAHKLYARIRIAARDVCADEGVAPMLNAPKVSACRRAAVDAAIASVNSPLLNSLHGQAGGDAQRRIAGSVVLR